MNKLVLIVTSIFLIPLFGFAASQIEKTESLIKKLAVEVSATKHQLFNENKIERKIKGAMYTLDKKIKKASKKRARMAKDLMGVEDDVNKLNHRISESQVLIEKQKIYLAKRIRAVYKIKDSNLVRMLLSEDVNFDKNLKFLNIIINQDYDVIKDYKLNLAALELQKRKLKKKQSKLIAMQKNYSKQKKKLEGDQASQTKILKAIKKAQFDKLVKIKKLRSKLKKRPIASIDGVLEKLLEKTFFELKGRLPKPVSGSVILGYGLHRDKEYASTIRLKGDLFKSISIKPVYAVHSGEVKFVGPMPGYGNIIIIDHGQNYYSIYGYGEDIVVEVGDHVKVKQEIAKTGNINHNEEKGLYFELRHFSDPIDPKLWLAKN